MNAAIISGGAASRYGNKPAFSATGTRCHAAQTRPRTSTPQRRPHAAIARVSPPPAHPSSSSTLVRADPPADARMESSGVSCSRKLAAPTATATPKAPSATRSVVAAAPNTHPQDVPESRFHRLAERAKPASAGLRIIASLPRSTSCGSAVAINPAGRASTMMTKKTNRSWAKATLNSPSPSNDGQARKNALVARGHYAQSFAGSATYTSAVRQEARRHVNHSPNLL